MMVSSRLNVLVVTRHRENAASAPSERVWSVVRCLRMRGHHVNVDVLGENTTHGEGAASTTRRSSAQHRTRLASALISLSRRAESISDLILRPLPHFSEHELSWNSLGNEAELLDSVAKVDLLVIHQAGLSHLGINAPEHVKVFMLLDEDKSRFAPTRVQRLQHGKIRRHYRAVIGRSVLVAVLSDRERNYILQRAGLSLQSTRVFTVPLGINLEHWAAQSSVQSEVDWVDVGVFGGMTYERRCTPVVKALEAARLAGYDWTWRIVGKVQSPWLDVFRRHGAICTQSVLDMRPYYEASRVVLVPHEKVPGMKSTLLEALILGRPVVATEAAAVGTGLKDGEHVLLAHSAADTIPRVAELLQDPCAAQAMANRAMDYARNAFDSNRLAERIVRELERSSV